MTAVLTALLVVSLSLATAAVVRGSKRLALAAVATITLFAIVFVALSAALSTM